ncbi:hypothetical protein FPQ18DRAFT_378232 [Pyronema domesticum]|nr:hypothetical protein FPQ18DRAFT_378232 [Pyronema domesticum]
MSGKTNVLLTYDKTTATAHYKERLQATLEDANNIVAYTDGSLGERDEDTVMSAGVGIYSAQAGISESLALGEGMEVYGAELEGIYQVAQRICGQRRFRSKVRSSPTTKPHWKKKPDKLFLENRIICSTVTQVKTGHGHFASYLYRMGFRIAIAAPLALPDLEKPPNTSYSNARATPRLVSSRRRKAAFRYTQAFLYRDIAHEALAELIRETRIGTRMERANKEVEREGNEEAEGGGPEEDGEDEEEGDEEEWEEDVELVGAVAMPVLPEEALEAAGRWLFNEFGDTNGDI